MEGTHVSNCAQLQEQLYAESWHPVHDKGDQANLAERVLFPGLNGLSRWPAR